MLSKNYLDSKFEDAMKALKSESNPRVGLKEAFRIAIFPFNKNDWPVEIQDDCENLINNISKVKQNSGHYIDDTIQNASDSEIQGMINEFKNIYQKVKDLKFI